MWPLISPSSRSVTVLLIPQRARRETRLRPGWLSVIVGRVACRVFSNRLYGARIEVFATFSSYSIQSVITRDDRWVVCGEYRRKQPMIKSRAAKSQRHIEA